MKALVACLAVAAVGCGAGKSTLELTVGARGSVAGIDHLRIFVTTAAGQKSKEADWHVGGAIPPSVTVPLRLPSSVRGKTLISVDAMAAGMTAPLASVSGSVTISPSTTAMLGLELAGGTGAPDMGPPAGPPAQLGFTAQPSDTAIGVAIKPPVSVAVEDANGVVVTGANTPITIALGNNPSHAVLGGTLMVTPVNGVASFADLTLDADGAGYTLTAAAGMLTGATSTAFNVRAPVWTQATNGIFGGVTNVVAAAGTPTTLYAGTRDAGIFVSTDGGGTWRGVPNGLPAVAVNGLAIDPGNVQHVFAATDDGVWVTSNGGTAWTATYRPMPAQQFPAVALDPAAPTHVFAGTFGKVFKTSDDGASWADDSTGLPAGRITSLSVGAAGVLATVYNEAGSGGGVNRQPNAGGAWTKDATWPTTGSGPGSYPQAVATNAAGSIAVCMGDIGNFLSSNGSATWTALTTGAPNNLQATRGLAAAVDPGNAAHLFVGGLGAACGAMCNGVWYSTDSGATWNAYGGLLGSQTVTAIAVDDPGSQIFAATSVGIFKQPMAGGTSALANGGLTALPVLALGADGAVFAGTTLGSVFKTSDGGMNWGPSSGSGATAIGGTSGNISSLAFDPTTAMTVYAAQSATGVWKSTDGGASWTNAGSNASGLTDLAISALVVAPTNAMLVYAGSNLTNVLFKSTNGGTSWASANLTTAAGVSGIVIDPTSSSTLYVIGGSSIYKTTNGGTSWTTMNGTLPSTSPFTGLALDGASAATIYLANKAGALFKSSDGATSWSAAGTLPVTSVSMLAAHPQKPGLVYAATSGGVYRTTDGGANWVAFNVGLTSVDALSVVFDRADPTVVYVGTAGGGVYRATP